MSHERDISSRAPLASARKTLRRLPPTHPGLWLVRPSCAKTKAPIDLVLLHELPGLLVALGEGAVGHG